MCGVHRDVCVPQIKSNSFLLPSVHSCIGTISQTLAEMYPCNLCTSGSQREIFWQIPSIDIVEKSSFIIQDLIVFKRFLVPGLQSSTAFGWSFSLSCSRRAFRIVASNSGGYVFNNVVCTSASIQCFPKLLSRNRQRSSLRLFWFSNCL